MEAHKIVSRDEWLVARTAHLAREKALTRRHSARHLQLPRPHTEGTQRDGPNHDLTDWIRHHDKYDDEAAADRCCAMADRA
jgi:predicted dithiol-disulfide oxidoreductase (DUF899 family)